MRKKTKSVRRDAQNPVPTTAGFRLNCWHWTQYALPNTANMQVTRGRSAERPTATHAFWIPHSRNRLPDWKNPPIRRIIIDLGCLFHMRAVVVRFHGAFICVVWLSTCHFYSPISGLLQFFGLQMARLRSQRVKAAVIRIRFF